MQNVSVNRMGTLWILWDGEVIYDHPMTCELREPLDCPPDPTLHWYLRYNGEHEYSGNQISAERVRCHDFGGVTEDCILAPNGVWYHLGMTHIKFIDGKWYATWPGWRNDHLALMLNAGFWAYRSYFPIRWLLRNLYRRVRYAIIERLVRLDRALDRRSWRTR